MADMTQDAENPLQEIKKKGVSKGRLENLDLEHKIDVWHKATHRAALQLLFPGFPREALIAFCTKVRVREDDKYCSVMGGDFKSLKAVLDWVKSCAESRAKVKVSEHDGFQVTESKPHPLQPALHLVLAAHLLGVPEADLQDFLIVRLKSMARRHLMPMSQVDEIYSVGSEVYEAGLTEVACTSIFSAWWDLRLDESTEPELMTELYDLRQKHPELDQDLHDAVEEKKSFIRQKKQGRRQRKATNEENVIDEAQAIGSGRLASAQVTAGRVDEGEASQDTGSTTAISSWDTAAITETNIRNCENQKLDQGGEVFWNQGVFTDREKERDGDGTGDWADEVNDDFAASDRVPFMSSVW